jgi:8-oxo-dGTP pyrophosphatase MutT (NUDIX family)
MRQPIQVLVYPVKRTEIGDWEYLLLRRISSRGGFWQGVTGGVEGGESLIEAAKRELAEETGFITSNLYDINYSYSFPIEDRWRNIYVPGTEIIVEHVFVAEINNRRFPELSCEHDKFRWCNFEKALRLLQWPDNVEALKRSNTFLKDFTC